MPEGDTIFRAARTLHRALAGKPVTSFESALPVLNRIHDDAPITGRTIERVSAVGKHHYPLIGSDPGSRIPESQIANRELRTRMIQSLT